MSLLYLLLTQNIKQCVGIEDVKFLYSFLQNIGWFDNHANSTGALTTKLVVDASEVKGVRFC